MLKAGIGVAVAGFLFVVAGFWAGFTVARGGQPPAPSLRSVAGGLLPSAQPAVAASTGPHPSFSGLQQSIAQQLQAAGARGGVTVVELAGSSPQTWSYSGDEQFIAASTYKLPLLMEEAQNLGAGRSHGSDSLCYQDSDSEDGWFSDYTDGTCMTRSELDQRIAQYSDNTAAHIVIRYDGGGAALNSYARAHGARESQFYDPNMTTSSDLARLWADESAGHAGGRAAQQWMYPLLTHTAYEDGIPAGVPSRTTVVHKIGIVDDEVNDAALIQGGPRGAYVLTICTEGAAGDAGWKLVADISRAVWQFEGTR